MSSPQERPQRHLGLSEARPQRTKSQDVFVISLTPLRAFIVTGAVVLTVIGMFALGYVVGGASSNEAETDLAAADDDLAPRYAIPETRPSEQSPSYLDQTATGSTTSPWRELDTMDEPVLDRPRQSPQARQQPTAETRPVAERDDVIANPYPRFIPANGPYYIQIATHKDRYLAEDISRRINRNGFDSKVAAQSDEQWIISIGPLTTSQEARRIYSDLVDQAGVAGIADATIRN